MLAECFDSRGELEEKNFPRGTHQLCKENFLQGSELGKSPCILYVLAERRSGGFTSFTR